MSALIVGGDRIGTYKDYLVAQGFDPIVHWNGRNGSECHRKIPSRTRLVVILVDQVNHRLALKMRRIAQDMELPVVFSRRSILQLDQAIARFRGDAATTSLQSTSLQ